MLTIIPIIAGFSKRRASVVLLAIFIYTAFMISFKSNSKDSSNSNGHYSSSWFFTWNSMALTEELLVMKKSTVYRLNMSSAHCDDANSSNLGEEELFWPVYLSNEAILERTRVLGSNGTLNNPSVMDCMSYLDSVGSVALLNNRTATREEEEFPLAFAISAHHQIGILEQFLASTFRPSDSVCIHIDAKAKDDVWNAAKAIVTCYKKVFPDSTILLPENRHPVFWGYISVIEADLRCMRALMEENENWKYLLNPAGTSLPVVTSNEMRRRLSKVNGSGVIDSFPLPAHHLKDRFKKKISLQRAGKKEYDLKVKPTDVDLEPPPHNMTIRKGSKDVAMTRQFVDLVIGHSVSWQLLDWLSNCHVADEHFYSTLVTLNFDTISSKLAQDLSTDYLQGECVRFSMWYENNCSGQYWHAICNFGIKELQMLRNSSCLIANKFSMSNPSSQRALLCQAHYLKQRTREDMFKKPSTIS